jgi:NADH-quinone oxidoreductase subunit E
MGLRECQIQGEANMVHVRESIIGETLSMDSLIPILQHVQSKEGYLSHQSMEEISQSLRVPVSKIYGVATFYRQFRFAPLGQHVIQLCRGTACHVRGSLQILQHLKRRLKLRADGNSPDGLFSVLTVACLGCCALAPVMTLDNEFYGHLTAEKLDKIIDDVGGAK